MMSAYLYFHRHPRGPLRNPLYTICILRRCSSASSFYRKLLHTFQGAVIFWPKFRPLYTHSEINWKFTKFFWKNFGVPNSEFYQIIPMIFCVKYTAGLILIQFLQPFWTNNYCDFMTKSLRRFTFLQRNEKCDFTEALFLNADCACSTLNVLILWWLLLQHGQSFDDVSAPPPIFGNSDPCICSIRGDPIIVKFDGTRRAIQGSQTVNLFYNAERKTRVTAKLGPGKGMLSKLTVIESVAVSVGGDEDKLIFSEGAIQASVGLYTSK